MRAGPRGIGRAGASEPLRLEVRLLGAVLGQVLVEEGGPKPLELVERMRVRTIALRPIYDLPDRFDDARLAPREDREVRRRLREAITILWQADGLGEVRPWPLHEVRSAMGFFDMTLFEVAPRLIRAPDAALDMPRR